MLKLCFFHGGGLVEWLIETWTCSPLCHVGVAVADDTEGSVQYWEAVTSGVRTLGGPAAKVLLAEGVLLVELPLPPGTPEAVTAFLNEHVGNPYEYVGVVTLGLALLTGQRVERDLPGHQFCSQLACGAAKVAGYFSEVDPADVAPDDLARMAIQEAQKIGSAVWRKNLQGAWQRQAVSSPS